MTVAGRGKYVCPTCGHPVLPTDPLGFLGPLQRRLFDLVYRSGTAGIMSGALRERLYEGVTDGGMSACILSTNIHYLNRKLRVLGMKIHSDRAGLYGSRYTVRRLLDDRQEPIEPNDDG